MVSKPRSFRKLLSAFGLALIASLALSAVAAGTASAGYWNSCKKVGEGKGFYKDAACSEESKSPTNIFGWSKLEAATELITSGIPRELAGLPYQSSIVFSGSFFGAGELKIACSGETSGTNTIANPVGGGTFEGALKFTGCQVNLSEETCKIVGGKITTNNLKGTASSGGINLVGPGASKFVFQITFEGCKNKGLNVEYHFAGSLGGATVVAAYPLGSHSQALEFTGSTLTMYGSGKSFKVEGLIKTENKAGEAVTIKP